VRFGVLDADRRVIALGIARMGEAVGISFLIVVIPLFIASEAIAGDFFGLTETAITGIILSIFGFVNSPLQPVVGQFSDRIGGRKRLILFGLTMLAVTNFAYSLATTY
jgi:MFS family permease